MAARASVKVQIDSAAPVTATVSGSSWSAAIAKQKRGTHTLKATLYLGGAERATASRTFVVK